VISFRPAATVTGFPFDPCRAVFELFCESVCACHFSFLCFCDPGFSGFARPLVAIQRVSSTDGRRGDDPSGHQDDGKVGDAHIRVLIQDHFRRLPIHVLHSVVFWAMHRKHVPVCQHILAAIQPSVDVAQFDLDRSRLHVALRDWLFHFFISVFCVVSGYARLKFNYKINKFIHLSIGLSIPQSIIFQIIENSPKTAILSGIIFYHDRYFLKIGGFPAWETGNAHIIDVGAKTPLAVDSYALAPVRRS
jgi:hypothetical protein